MIYWVTLASNPNFKIQFKFSLSAIVSKVLVSGLWLFSGDEDILVIYFYRQMLQALILLLVVR